MVKYVCPFAISVVAVAVVMNSRMAENLRTRWELVKVQQKLHDWANLNRYRDSNASVSASGTTRPRIVFLGDSITQAWTRRWKKFSPSEGYFNRGIAGQTTAQMLVRFRPDVLALNPMVVVILAGTNDLYDMASAAALKDAENNLTSMVELARANGIMVVLSSVLPVCDYHKPQSTHRAPSLINALNERIRALAARNQVFYLDYYSAMSDGSGMLKKDLSDDCLHPNRNGYAVMEPLAETAIAEALRGSSRELTGRGGSFQ